MKNVTRILILAIVLAFGTTTQAQVRFGVGVFIGTPPPPPPPRYEVMYAQPFTNAVWVPGYWSFDRPHSRYVWFTGRWNHRPNRYEQRGYRHDYRFIERHDAYAQGYGHHRDNDNGRSKQGR